MYFSSHWKSHFYREIYMSCAPPSSSLYMNFNINLNQFMIFSAAVVVYKNICFFFSDSFIIFYSISCSCACSQNSHQQTLNLFQLQLTRFEGDPCGNVMPLSVKYLLIMCSKITQRALEMLINILMFL